MRPLPLPHQQINSTAWENRMHGSEGGVGERSSLPLSDLALRRHRHERGARFLAGNGQESTRPGQGMKLSQRRSGSPCRKPDKTCYSQAIEFMGVAPGTPLALTKRPICLSFRPRNFIHKENCVSEPNKPPLVCSRFLAAGNGADPATLSTTGLKS